MVKSPVLTIILFCLIAISVAILGVRVLTNRSDADRLSIHISAYPAIFEPEEAAAASTLAIRGTVHSISPARWNTIDGKAPEDFDVDRVPGDYVIYRTAYVDVENTLLGAGLDRVPVTLIGGEVGNVALTVSDLPGEFTIGDEVVLFLKPSEDPADDAWTIVESFKVVGEVATNEFQDDLDVKDLEDRVARAVEGIDEPRGDDTP